jgi:hypothetical protein
MNRIAFAVGLLMLVGCGAEPEGEAGSEIAAAEATCVSTPDPLTCSATYEHYHCAKATIVHRDGANVTGSATPRICYASDEADLDFCCLR